MNRFIKFLRKFGGVVAPSPLVPPLLKSPQMDNALVGYEVIKESMIKPSSPTPPSLQHYKLSLIDQFSTSSYVPVAIFFTKESFDTCNEKNTILQKSLSELLTYYYPFAGRLIGNSVECNDMGAVFREVRVECSVRGLLEKPHASLEDAVFPVGLPWNVPGGSSLTVAQLSHFDCGGRALSLCMSHKIGGGTTLFNFLSDWAIIARKAIEKPCPLFNGAAIYPPIESQDNLEGFEIKNQKTYISTTISFGSSQLNRLKTLATANAGVKNPTRAEVVTAILTKSFLAASMVDSLSFKPIVLFIAVNLRPRIDCPIKQNSVGNFYCCIHVPVFCEEDMKFESLVAKIRSEKIRVYEKYRLLNENERVAIVHEEMEFFEKMGSKVEFYTVTSLCGMAYQDLDFGWGKPLKATFAALPKKNYFMLLNDLNGKGVEAITTVEEKVLKTIQRDQEFLSFATLPHPTSSSVSIVQ